MNTRVCWLNCTTSTVQRTALQFNQHTHTHTHVTVCARFLTPGVGGPDDVVLGEDSHLGVVVVADTRVLVHTQVHVHLRHAGTELRAQRKKEGVGGYKKRAKTPGVSISQHNVAFSIVRVRPRPQRATPPPSPRRMRRPLLTLLPMTNKTTSTFFRFFCLSYSASPPIRKKNTHTGSG